jgi:hypothetical protein
MIDAMKKTFEKQGYDIERAVFSENECRKILKSIRMEDEISPPIWGKSWAVASPSWASIVRN